MSFFKTIISRNFIAVLIVIIFAVLASRTLLFQKGYFVMHDDLQMMRQLQMEKCFDDGQIPCRWVTDMGYGYGFPLFNFYPPLPYLIGEGIRLLGFSFVNTVKIVFALSIVLSGITMCMLAKEFFGRIGGVLSAVFYIWAPYHAVDVYVRGAMNESWALVWFPLIFLYSYRLIISQKDKLARNLVLLSLSYSLLLMSHNLMVLIFTPFLAFWVLLHLWRERSWSRIPQLILSGIFALGLAAFFTVPALAENQYTQVAGVLTGYFNYLGHFVSLNQLLFSRFWGYGGSAWMTVNDGMSFSIGHLHWILSLLIFGFLIIRAVLHIHKLRDDKLLIVTTFMIIVGWFSVFLTHSRSTFIWQTIPFLRYTQFPWRFLTITIFAFSFVVGIIPGAIAGWKARSNFLAKLILTPPQLITSVFLILFVVALGWNYFLPKDGRMGPLTDEEKFSGAAWELQQGAGIKDYIPKTSREVPTKPRDEAIGIIGGEAVISSYDQGTYWAKFDINSLSENTVVRLGIFDFPGWKAYVDNRESRIYIPEEEYFGRIYFNVLQGEHKVYVQFMNTPVRTVSNLVSVASWLLLLSFPLWRKRKLM
jgi:uncharacterized membrane protein